MIRWLVLCGVLCSGCDAFFSLHHFEHDAAVIDAGDAALPPPPCSKMSMLADSFGDDSIGLMWPTTKSVSEIGGYAHIDLTSSMSASMTSERFYDLRDDHIQLAITDNGNFNPGNATDRIELVAASTRPGYALTITRAGPNLHFDRTENNVVLSLGTVPYDLVMHHYWRIANAGRVTTFETSPDGLDFTVQASVMDLDYVGFMRIDFGAQTGSNPGYVLDLDDVNGGVATGIACPMTVLADRFDGGTIDERWARSTLAGGTISEHDGILEMAFLTAIATNTYFVAASIYDLTAAPLSAELPQMVDVSTTSTQVFQMAATSPTHDLVAFRESAGVLYALYNAPSLGNDLLVNMKPYSPDQHRWWRFRLDGNITFWETSADGLAWDIWGSTNNLHGFARTDVYFEIVGVTASPGAVQLDNVDLPPP